jgi:D-alanyl-D-alanine carboxypeptidase
MPSRRSKQPDDEHNEIDWAPPAQKPADSYSSFRRFRDAAESDRRARSGEMPAIRRPTTDTDPSLPRPGAPLFGSQGIVSRPYSESASQPSLFRPPSERTQRTQARRAVRIEESFYEEEIVEEEYREPEPRAPRRPRREPPLRIILPALPSEDVSSEPDQSPESSNKWLSPRYRALYFSLTALVTVLALLGYPLLSASAHNAPPRDSKTFSASSFSPGPIYLPATVDVDHPPPLLWASSAFLMDESTGAVLYAKNPNQHMPMASTTKFMTAVVALAHGNPDQVITITKDAADTDCTCMGLHPGDKYTLRELLYGMLLLSANDVAVAIADGVAGNVRTFVGWMNATAKSMGLDNSYFINPNGLPGNGDDGYSSAHDLAVLARYALSNSLIHTISGTRTYVLAKTATHPLAKLTNYHQPLWWYPGADGGKPGWTLEAQFVDILSSARDGHHLIGVIMHSLNDWVTDIRDLLNWGFDDFSWVSPRDIDHQHWIPYDDAYGYFNWDVPSRTVQIGNQEYFPYTGYIVSGVFLTYFNQQKGLPTFGYPDSMPVPVANGMLKQHFTKVAIQCTVASGKCQIVANR